MRASTSRGGSRAVLGPKLGTGLTRPRVGLGLSCDLQRSWLSKVASVQGVAECQRALELDRNLADAHVMMGIAKFHGGRGADTEAHVNEALRLSPRDIFAFHWMSTAGVAKLQIEADAEQPPGSLEESKPTETFRICILTTLHRSRFLEDWTTLKWPRTQDLHLIQRLLSVGSKMLQCAARRVRISPARENPRPCPPLP